MAGPAPPAAPAVAEAPAGPRLAPLGGCWVLDEPMAGRWIGDEVCPPDEGHWIGDPAAGGVISDRAFLRTGGATMAIRYLREGTLIDNYVRDRMQDLLCGTLELAGPRLAPRGGCWVLDEPMEDHCIGGVVYPPAGTRGIDGRALMRIGSATMAIRQLREGTLIDNYVLDRMEGLVGDALPDRCAAGRRSGDEELSDLDTARSSLTSTARAPAHATYTDEASKKEGGAYAYTDKKERGAYAYTDESKKEGGAYAYNDEASKKEGGYADTDEAANKRRRITSSEVGAVDTWWGLWP